MPGRVKPGGSWTFSICGKHPAAADYVALGDHTPWFSAMSKVVASAYSSILARGHPPDDLAPWDFWIALEHKDGLACGRLVPSRDRLNRPYPLLIMGQGSLQGWAGFWERLPLAMESTWDGMVGLASFQGHSLDTLAIGLSVLPAPDGGWTIRRDEAVASGRGGSGPGRCHYTDGVVRLEIESEISGCAEWGRVVDETTKLLKQNGRTPAPPRAVFIQRGPAWTSMRLFFRPVCSSDFVDMWRSNGRDQDHGSN